MRAVAVTTLAIVALSASAQILFKVEKPGSDKVSYLLGTHHFAPVAMLDSLRDLPAALDGIDQLYGEIDMDAKHSAAEVMKLQKYMMAPKDSTLDKFLEPAQLDSLQSVMESYGTPRIVAEFIKNMKPAAASTQLSALMGAKMFPGLDPLANIDIVMQQKARQNGKPVHGFETMEQQMEILMGGSLREQADALLELIRNIEAEEVKAVELTEAYLNRDLPKVLELMEAEIDGPEAEASFAKLVYDRNARWLDTLQNELPQKSLMVVVGAGHLPGDRGLIKGLEALGYNVTPLQ